MKASLMAIALIVPVGIALAQKEPGNESKSNGSNTQLSHGQATQSSSSTKTGNTGTVKTKMYKGTLVDAACASGGGPTSSTGTTSRTASAERSSSSASTSKSGEASRAAGGGQSCDATSSTTEFGLRMRDGQVLRFDTVGNERAKQEMSSKKKWSNDAAAGKPIHVSVSGTENGDRLTVMSIH